MKVLVLGASGMLAASLIPHLRAAGHDARGHSRSAGMGDLSDLETCLRLLRKESPEVAVNLAGLTDVDRCETHPKEAFLANVKAVENIAAACEETHTHLIHVSTDQVYDLQGLCVEADASPGNQYAMTKYAGELAAATVGATILRTNFVGASRHPTRRSLTDWLFRALTARESIQVFEDVSFSPLCMDTLCDAMERVLDQRHPGVFNLGSSGGMSKADFAFLFAAALGLSTDTMKRGTVAKSGLLKAWRPRHMCMDSSLFAQSFGQALPSLESEIHRTAKDYRDNS